MLLASGVPFLLAALWGLGRGSRWLVGCLLAGGLLAYGCAIGVHFVVGYTDFVHLLPAWLGLGLLLAGCALAWPWASAAGVVTRRFVAEIGDGSAAPARPDD
jgi:hypothetical protein